MRMPISDLAHNVMANIGELLMKRRADNDRQELQDRQDQHDQQDQQDQHVQQEQQDRLKQHEAEEGCNEVDSQVMRSTGGG